MCKGWVSEMKVNDQLSQNKPQSAKINLTQVAEGYGLDKVAKSSWQSFGLAIFAGAFIALAFVFYITVTTGSQGSWGMTH